jgi:uncharacterized coiled-coil protein SlyX
MSAPKEASKDLPAVGISEAERMAKIRELLVGPVIADESARVDEAVSELNDLVRAQQEVISKLQVRIGELEELQRLNNKQLRLRMLGIVETLLADEADVSERLSGNQMLTAELEDDRKRDST